MKLFRSRLAFFLVVLMGFTPIIWFIGKPGVLINGSDTNFPLDPAIWFARRFFVWNSVASAGGDFSSSTAGIFFHLIQFIPFKLGFSLQLVQITSFVFWFLLIVVASFIFARVILQKNIFAQFTLVIFYSFNIYLFNTWENVKVANLSLVASIPLALSILILAKRGRISKKAVVFYSVLVGVLVSGTGINPAYFVSFFLVLTIYVLAQVLVNFSKEAIIGILRNFSLLSTLIILVNSFWILPTSSFIIKNIGPGKSIDTIGYTNWIDSLSKNASILNIIRLQGAWDWYAFDGVTGLPLYIPYALNFFFRMPFIIFSLGLPVLVIVSLLFANKKMRDLYLAFGLMFILGIFLGVGTHLPTGHAFRFFASRVPFFTLFRSPWYIFTVLVTLAIAGLLGLLVYRLDKKFFPLGLLLAVILIVGNLLYTYPLVTGKIFRPTMSDNFLISFPSYVFDTQDWLSQTEVRGRIVGYPDDEIERFSWGYNGIDSILALLADKENIFSSLNATESPVSQLTREFYQALKKEQIASARALASKLNIGLVFEKEDQGSLAPGLPGEFEKLSLKKFEKWNFYEFPGDGSYVPKIYSVSKVFYGYPYEKGAKILPILGKDELLLNSEDSQVVQISGISSLAGRVILTDNSQAKDLFDFLSTLSTLEERLVDRTLSNVDFTVKIFETGMYQPILETYELGKFGIELNEALEVNLDGKIVTWEIERLTDSFVYFTPLELLEGDHKFSLILENVNLISEGDFQGETSFTPDGQGDFDLIKDGDEVYLSIFNKSDRDISANFSLSTFNPMSHYYIKVRYKQIYGDNASFLINQGRDNVLVTAQKEWLPNYPEWGVFSFYYQPVKTNSKLDVSLLAPYTKDALGTKVLYDDLGVWQVFTNNLVFIKQGQQKLTIPSNIDFKKKSPVLYEGEVREASQPHIIVFSENYSDQWELTAFDDSGKNLELTPIHFSANLFANAWYIEGTPRNYKFKIYYKSQRLFNIGLSISGLSLGLATALFIKEVNFGKKD